MPRELEIRTTIFCKKPGKQREENAASSAERNGSKDRNATFESEAFSLMEELEHLKTKLKETDQHIVNTYRRKQKDRKPESRSTAISVAYLPAGYMAAEQLGERRRQEPELSYRQRADSVPNYGDYEVLRKTLYKRSLPDYDVVVSQPIQREDRPEKDGLRWTTKYTPARAVVQEEAETISMHRYRAANQEGERVKQQDIQDDDFSPDAGFQRIYARPSGSSVHSSGVNESLASQSPTTQNNERTITDEEMPRENVQGQADDMEPNEITSSDPERTAIGGKVVQSEFNDANNNNSNSHDKPPAQLNEIQETASGEDQQQQEATAPFVETKESQEVEEKNAQVKPTKTGEGDHNRATRNYDRDEIRQYMAKQRQLRQMAAAHRPRNENAKKKNKPPLPPEARAPAPPPLHQPPAPRRKSPVAGVKSCSSKMAISPQAAKINKLEHLARIGGKKKSNVLLDEDWGPYEKVQFGEPLRKAEELSAGGEGVGEPAVVTAVLESSQKCEKSVQTQVVVVTRQDESVQVTQTRNRKIQISIDADMGQNGDQTNSSASASPAGILRPQRFPKADGVRNRADSTSWLLDSSVNSSAASAVIAQPTLPDKLPMPNKSQESILKQIEDLEVNIARLLQAPVFNHSQSTSEQDVLRLQPPLISPLTSLAGSPNSTLNIHVDRIDSAAPKINLNITGSTQYKDLPPDYVRVLPARKSGPAKLRPTKPEEPLTYFRDFNEILRMETAVQTQPAVQKPPRKSRQLPSFLELSVPASSYNFFAALSDKMQQNATDSDSTSLEVPKFSEKSGNSTPQPQGFPKNGFQLETADNPLQKTDTTGGFESKSSTLERTRGSKPNTPPVESNPHPPKARSPSGSQSGLELGPLTQNSFDSYRTLTPQQTSYGSTQIQEKLPEARKALQVEDITIASISPIPRVGSPNRGSESGSESAGKSHSSEKSSKGKLNSTLSEPADPNRKNPAELLNLLKMELHRSEAIDSRINQIEQLHKPATSAAARIAFDSTTKSFFEQQTAALRSIVEDLQTGFKRLANDESLKKGRQAAARVDQVSSQVRSINVDSSVHDDSMVSMAEGLSTKYESDFEASSQKQPSESQVPTGSSLAESETDSATTESRVAQSKNLKSKLDRSTFGGSDASDSSILHPKAMELLLIEEAKQQRLLVKLREKAKVEKTLAELELLQMQKRILRSQGEKDKVASIKKKQRGLLLKLQEERAKFESLRKQQKKQLEEKLQNAANRARAESSSWETDSSLQSVHTDTNQQPSAVSIEESIVEQVGETQSDSQPASIPSAGSGTVAEEAVNPSSSDSNQQRGSESSSFVPCVRIRTPLSPRTDIRMQRKFRRRNSSGSDDSLNLSQAETISDSSDVESRVLALTEELQRRQSEAARLKQEQKRANKEQLRAKESSLLKQIEAYDRCILDLRKQLDAETEADEVRLSPVTAAVKPLIRQPRAAVRSEDVRTPAMRKLDLGEPRTESSASISEEIEGSRKVESETAEELQISDMASQKSDISGRKSDIEEAEIATDIPHEKSDILDQSSDIASEKTDISKKESDIVRPESKMSSQKSEIATEIPSQKSDIGSQKSDISDNMLENASEKTRFDISEAPSQKSDVVGQSPELEKSDSENPKPDKTSDGSESDSETIKSDGRKPDLSNFGIQYAAADQLHAETESAESEIPEKISEVKEDSYSEDFCESAPKDETEADLSLSEIPVPEIATKDSEPELVSDKSAEPQPSSDSSLEQPAPLEETEDTALFEEPQKKKDFNGEAIVESILEDLVAETVRIAEEYVAKQRKAPTSQVGNSVLQRVSQILAQNALTVTTKNSVPQITASQLYLTTTFDLPSPDQVSPQQSPNAVQPDAKNPDISFENEWIEDDLDSTSFGSSQSLETSSKFQDAEQEAEALEREQKRIQEEIQRLSESVLYMQNIPSKPPPPYTPPGQSLQWQKAPQQGPSQVTELHVVPHAKDQVTKLCSSMIWYMLEKLEHYSEAVVDYAFPEELADTTGDDELVATTRKAFSQFVFDLTRHFVTDFRKDAVFLPGYKTLTDEVTRRKPIRARDAFHDIVKSKVLTELNYEPRFLRENQFSSWARKRRDRVDEILIYELQIEDKIWSDFSCEEEEVKQQTVDAILDQLLQETADVLQDVWQKRHVTA